VSPIEGKGSSSNVASPTRGKGRRGGRNGNKDEG